MCKKTLLTKIKDASKIIPKSVNNIKTSTVQKAKNLIQQTNVKQVFQKTKQQINQKSEMMKNYANSAKQATQQKTSQMKAKGEKIISSATESIQRIKVSQNINKKKDALFQYAQKVKQSMQDGKKSVSKTTEKILNTASDIKDKITDANILNQKKQAVTSYAFKLKEGMKQKSQTISKSANNLFKASIQIKDKKKQELISYADKIKNGLISGKDKMTKSTQNLIQSTTNVKDKIQQIVSSTKQEQKVEPPKRIASPVQQISKKYLTYIAPKQEPKQTKMPPSMLELIMEKGRKIHEKMFSNYVVNNAKKSFGKILGNVYWRLIFGACLIVFVYGVSTQLPRQLRLHFSQKRRQKEQEQKMKRLNDKIY